MVKIKDLKDRAYISPDISAIPAQFIGKINSAEIREDKKGNECLYVDIEIDNGDSFTEKYLPLHLTEMTRRMDMYNVKATEDLEGIWYEWESMSFNIGFPRHFPKLEKIVGEK